MATTSNMLAEILLHLLVSTRAVIGQFGGPYSPVRPAKFKVFLTFIAIKSLKLSFTLNCILKRANDLKNDFKLTRFAFGVRQKFEAVTRELNSFLTASDTVEIIIFSCRDINILPTWFSPSVL